MVPENNIPAADKAAAARMGRAVADSFNAAAGAAELQRALPVAAVKLFEAGEAVTPEALRAHAEKGPAHLKELCAALNRAVTARPLSYQGIVGEWRRDRELEKLLAMEPDEAALNAYLHRHHGENALSYLDKFQSAALAAGREKWLECAWKMAMNSGDKTFIGKILCDVFRAGRPELAERFRPYLDEESLQNCIPNVNYAVQIAASEGVTDLLRWIHDTSDKNREWLEGMFSHIPDIFLVAAGRGWIDTVRYLHETAKPLRKFLTKALDAAAYKGQTEVVDYLMAHKASAAAYRHRAITRAAEFGHLHTLAHMREHDADLRTISKATIRSLAEMEFYDILTLLHRHGTMDATILTPAQREWVLTADKMVTAWQQETGDLPPSGLWHYDPRLFERAAFQAVCKLLGPEMGNKGRVDDDLIVNIYGYQLTALFGSEQEVLRYLKKWGDRGSKQPLHDLAVHLRLPLVQPKLFDREAWVEAILREGPPMAKLLRFANRLEKPLATVAETRAALTTTAYARSAAAPALSRLCLDLLVGEEDFSAALAVYLKQQAKGFPAKNIPDLRIDGAAFNMPGAVFRRLAPDDPRGLFLGEFTDCCQSIGNAGGGCARHGFTSPDSGFYVVEKDGEVIGQCWAWRSAKGALVFDSLETLGTRVSALQWHVLMKEVQGALVKDHPGVSGFFVGEDGGTPLMAQPGVEGRKAPRPKDYRDYRDSKKQYDFSVVMR